MRLTWIAASVLAALLVTAGCSTTPKEHPERLRKAAGVTAFRIQCTKDLWNRTGGLKGESWRTYKDPVKAQVTDQRNGTVVVQLTGPQLVDLLDKLNELAHPNKGEHAPDPLAVRMYDAIAPQIDTISTTAPGSGPIPQVVIDDKAGAPSSSSATAAPSASTQ